MSHRPDPMSQAAPAPTGRLLLVDPDPVSRRQVATCLRGAGHAVDERAQADPLAHAGRDGYALVLLDPAAPTGPGTRHGRDAWEGLRALRADGHRLPVIVLQPATSATDRCVALELGADAVLDKPAHPGELRARVGALLRRRRPWPEDDGLACGPWRLDTWRRRLRDADGTEVQLSPAEARLLQQFLTRPRHPFSRAELLTLAGERGAAPLDRSIDLLVSRLRHKLGLPAAGPIRTVRGVGYLFDALGASALGPALHRSRPSDDHAV